MSSSQTNLHLQDTTPSRPDRHKERQETLPHVDWEINHQTGPLKFPRPDSIVAGLVQFDPIDDKQANIQRALQLAWQASDDGAEVILFPEMFMLPWVFDDDEDVYEPLADASESALWEPFQSLASEKDVVLVCPYFERGVDGRLYNSAVVIDVDGYISGNYRKRHLPPDNERVHFTGGEGPLSAFNTRKGRIGVYICWDNFFPEGARALALDQADIVFAPTAATELASLYKWNIAIQHNAMINGIPWVRLNRCEEPFYANKMVVNAEGRKIFYSDDPNEHISLVEIDYTLTDSIRNEWTFLADRRPSIYQQLT